MNRLGKDVEPEALFGRALEKFRGGVIAGDEEDLAAGERGSKLNREFDAGHMAWLKNYIGDQNIAWMQREPLNGRDRVVCGRGVVAVKAKDLRHGIGYRPLVVEHQNFGLLSIHNSRP